MDNDFWTIGIPISLNNTIQAITEHRKTYNQLHSAFKDMPEAQDIYQLFVDLAYLVEDVQLLTQTPHRQTRAPLGFVGSVFHGLFGTAEDEEVQALRQKIANLDENQDHLTHYLAEQLTILNATAAEQTIHAKQLQYLAQGLKQLEHTVVQQIQSSQYLRARERLYDYRHHQSIIRTGCLQLTEHLTSFLVAYETALQGQVSPFVLSPRSFRHILSNISTQLPSTYSLPFSMKPGAEIQWYRYSSVSGIFTSPGTITFIIRIPLTHIRSKFRLFRVLPLTFSTTATTLFHRYNIPFEYFAINPSAPQYYIQIAQLPISCRQISNLYFCSETLLLQHKSVPSCLYAAFHNNSQDVSTRCGLQVVLHPSLQAVKVKSNQWLLNSVRQNSITWRCTDESQYPSSTSVLGTSLITIPASCVAFVEGYVFTADRTTFSQLATRKFSTETIIPINSSAIPPQSPNIPLHRFNLSVFTSDSPHQHEIQHDLQSLQHIMQMDSEHAGFRQLVTVSGSSIAGSIIVIIIATAISVVLSHFWLKRQLHDLQQRSQPGIKYERPRQIIPMVTAPARPVSPPPRPPGVKPLRHPYRRRAQSLADLDLSDG